MGISFLNRPFQTYASSIREKNYEKFFNHNFESF